jgi:hypothetical protein
MISQLTAARTRAKVGGRGRGPGGEPAGLPSAGHCPVPGCAEPVDPARLMCRRHWYLVPRPLRNRVWATWRSGLAAASPEHQEAVRAAITAAGPPPG